MASGVLSSCLNKRTVSVLLAFWISIEPAMTAISLSRLSLKVTALEESSDRGRQEKQEAVQKVLQLEEDRYDEAIQRFLLTECQLQGLCPCRSKLQERYVSAVSAQKHAEQLVAHLQGEQRQEVGLD